MYDDRSDSFAKKIQFKEFFVFVLFLFFWLARNFQHTETKISLASL